MHDEDAAAADDRKVVVRKVTGRVLRDQRGRSYQLTAKGAAVDIHVIELFEKAQPGRFHRHDKVDNWYYILEGEIRVRLLGPSIVLGSGDFAFIPKGTPHGVDVHDGPVRLVEGYEPGDADFIEVPEPPRVGIDPT